MEGTSGVCRIEVLIGELYTYLKENHRDAIVAIIEDPEEQKCFSIPLSFLNVAAEIPRTANQLLNLKSPLGHHGSRYNNVKEVLEAGQRAARQLQYDLLKLPGSSSASNKKSFKRNIFIRFHSLPAGEDDMYLLQKFPGHEKAGRFVAVAGKVGKAKSRCIVEFKKEFKCSACNLVKVVESDIQRDYAFPLLKNISCDNKNCFKGKMKLVSDSKLETMPAEEAHRFLDYQEVRIQEMCSSSKNEAYSIPKQLCVILQHDLVGSCKPGDNIVVTGQLVSRFKEFRKDQPIEIDLVLLANHVNANNESCFAGDQSENLVSTFKAFWTRFKDNPYEGRNFIVRSFCPDIYQMYVVKLALCIALAGGVEKPYKIDHDDKDDDDGANLLPSSNPDAKVRGNSHVLLVGDPGTAKSQLIKYVSKLIPRAILTTGIGSTNAGLTVSVLKEDGVWQYEAGALILANHSVCCIDELSGMKKHDSASIHEAMEQQTISVAKAGLLQTFDSKCTVLAASNPKFGSISKKHTAGGSGNIYYDDMSLEEVTGFESPLLSRFDIILLLKDYPSEDWDEMMADFVLAKKSTDSTKVETWDSATLSSYLMLIKKTKPKMLREAEVVIQKYYGLQRSSETRSFPQTTYRLLQSLIRLAEGHAKLMFRKTVQVHDAVVAITLVEASMQKAALWGSLSCMQSEFPQDPKQEYYNQAKNVLCNLGFTEDLWRTERIRLDLPLSVFSQELLFNSSPDHSDLFNVEENVTETPQSLLNEDECNDDDDDDMVPKEFFTQGLPNQDVPCSIRLSTPPHGEKRKSFTSTAASSNIVQEEEQPSQKSQKKE